MNFLESSEDYLERILILTKKNGFVRSIDIANDMSFSKASVSIAMKKLVQKNLITIDKKGYIYLTIDGKNIAESTYNRHCVLYEVFKKMGVDEKIAYEDACKVEHDISEETFNALTKFFGGNK